MKFLRHVVGDARRLFALALMCPGLLAGCGGSSNVFVPTDALDADNDGMRRFPWGADFDDDGDGALQFIAGGSDYDDTNAAVQGTAAIIIVIDPVSYPTGLGPTGLYLADFDRDGNPDLVTSNQNDSTGTVYFGAGDGTLVSPVTLTVPGDGGGSEAVAGDFDEDGQLDVVIGSHNYLFLNTGARTFGGGIDLGISGYRNVVTDLNGDGHLDLVGADYGNGVVALLGNGDGTFSAPVNSGAGVNSQALAIADFNGDTVPDAVVVTFEGVLTPGTVAVMLGNGDGSFQAPASTTLPSYGWQVAAADLDGDGDPDVVATDSIGGGKAYVLLNDGLGGLGAATGYDVANAERMAIADFNGDTVPDLAITSQTDGVWLGFGNGDGSFGTFTAFGAAAFDVDVGDLNNDGILDLVYVDITGNQAAVMLGG